MLVPEPGGGVAAASRTTLERPLLRGPEIARGARSRTDTILDFEVLTSTVSCHQVKKNPLNNVSMTFHLPRGIIVG